MEDWYEGNLGKGLRLIFSSPEVGASITTPDSLLMGYGFEGVSADQRDAVMGRTLDHLLGAGR